MLAAVIITHTTRHLRRTLLGVAASSPRPDRVVVSCDGDGEDLRACARDAAREFALPLTLVLRPHTGQSRSPQVRNNAVRTLADLPDSARLAFLDGDCCPRADFFDAHTRLGGPDKLVVGFRIDLTPDQTQAFDEAAVRRGQPPAALDTAQVQTLRARARRYRWSLLLRRLGLAKAHKPKVLSANFSCALGAYRAINGFDEEYIGWGAEDDDLGRRMYASGVTPTLGITQAIVFHQWHATRAPEAWHANAGAARFLKGTPVRALRGLENPLDQPAPRIEHLGSPS